MAAGVTQVTLVHRELVRLALGLLHLHAPSGLPWAYPALEAICGAAPALPQDYHTDAYARAREKKVA